VLIDVGGTTAAHDVAKARAASRPMPAEAPRPGRPGPL